MMYPLKNYISQSGAIFFGTRAVIPENTYCTESIVFFTFLKKYVCSGSFDARVSRYCHSSLCETSIDPYGESDIYFCDCFLQESVNVSLTNLLTFPWVKEKVIAKKLSLHGGFYDFVEGSFQVWDFDVTISHSKKF